jgi:hypothetical protein
MIWEVELPYQCPKYRTGSLCISLEPSHNIPGLLRFTALTLSSRWNAEVVSILEVKAIRVYVIPKCK